MRVIFILLFLTGCSLGTQTQEEQPTLKVQRGDLISFCTSRGNTMDCRYVPREQVVESLKNIYGLHY
jgi:PBP1b-binding outer membrane lipoprotein LpoB|tara:strand:- start:378 stop:578 length:201 start_codon:yes stop_codon:yes gene_type:complete